MPTAYISLNEAQRWTLYAGDGSEADPQPLYIGEVFEPGESIREAVALLEQWAERGGYRLIVPPYRLIDAALYDLIEPEVYEQVFGSLNEDG